MIIKKLFFNKLYKSLVKKILKSMGYKDYQHLSEKLLGTSLTPSEVRFPDKYKIFYFGKYILDTIPLENLSHDFSKNELAIIGSGPSLNNLSLENLKKMDVILLNGSISLITTHDIIPTAVCIIDETFCKKRFNLIKKIPKNTNLLLSFSALQMILNIDENFLKDYKLHLINFSYFTQFNYQNKWVSYKDLKKIESGFQDGGTVMSIALQFSVSFNTNNLIYLLGLDLGNAREPRFNENKNNQLKSGLISDYPLKILPFMEKISILCDEENIKVYNCSNISKLPYSIFPYSDLFKREKDIFL